MIGIQLRINNTLVMLNVQCIRVAPTGDVEEGDECTYLARIYNQDAGTIHHEYGDPVGLAHKMIDFYSKFSDERIEEFRVKGLSKRIKDMVDEN